MSQDLREQLEKWSDQQCPRLTDRWAMNEMLALLWPVIAAADEIAQFDKALTLRDERQLREALQELREKLKGGE
jgi:hypothetical protein